MNINLHLHPNSNYYCQLNVKCAFLREKKDYYCTHTYIYIYIYIYTLYMWACINIIQVFIFFCGGGLRLPYVYGGGVVVVVGVGGWWWGGEGGHEKGWEPLSRLNVLDQCIL